MNFLETDIEAQIETLPFPLLQLTAKEMGFRLHLDEQAQERIINLEAGIPLALLEKEWRPLLQSSLMRAYPDKALTVHLNAVVRPHQTQMLGRSLRGAKNTIAIASGKGGVGKSTLTVNLALALTKAGARVGILDADIYGPSIPLMLGQSQRAEIQGDLYKPVMTEGIQTMSIAYLTDQQQALLWRGPMLAKALIQMLDATAWDNLDYLLIDLPPGTGDIQLSLVQKIPLTGALVVTTPQQVATLDAQKAIQLFKTTGIHLLGLIENMATHLCSNCGHQESIFGEGGAQKIAEQNQVPLLGQIPLETAIQSACDEGRPAQLHTNSTVADEFMKIALKTALHLAQRPLNYASKMPPVVVE